MDKKESLMDTGCQVRDMRYSIFNSKYLILQERLKNMRVRPVCFDWSSGQKIILPARLALALSYVQMRRSGI